MYYKLRNKTTGLFSTGGAKPTFTVHGKVWRMPQLKAHLTMIKKGHNSFSVYKDCEIVTFAEVYTPADILLEDILKPMEEELIVKKLKGK